MSGICFSFIRLLVLRSCWKFPRLNPPNIGHSLNFPNLEAPSVWLLFEIPGTSSVEDLFQLPRTSGGGQLFEHPRTSSVAQLSELLRNSGVWQLYELSETPNPLVMGSCLNFPRFNPPSVGQFFELPKTPRS